MPDRPATASLDNPRYYLQNFRSVLRWVAGHHADLLTPQEAVRLAQFEALPEGSQALLVRMVMRKGDQFRASKLSYTEIGPTTVALQPLVSQGWVDPQPTLSLAQLFALLTRAELVRSLQAPLAQAGLKRNATKQAMLQSLAEASPQPAPLAHWCPGIADTVVALRSGPLFQRLQLMFFGNLHQDWSEFVLAELGHQRYEKLSLLPQSRAFQHRSEVDSYLQMQACRDRLDAGEAPAAVWPDISRSQAPSPWLESRRARLLFSLGRMAERAGDSTLARQAYRLSTHREARLRRLRLEEQQGEAEQVFCLVSDALKAPANAAEQLGLVRIRQRLGRRLGKTLERLPRPAAIPEIELVLPRQDSVEMAVVAHLSRADAPVRYVENRLLNGLFALLCWPALYAPLPGAFFHPFHAAPADLDRDDFIARRQTLFDDCLATLGRDDYRECIYQRWEQKQGIACPFIHWPTLTRELLDLALGCIPAQDLQACFERLLADLRAHRSGLPDLIQFWPASSRYRLVEVKGPGDRLQDHQRRWLEFCLSRGIDVALCHVRWQASPTAECET
ncbi:VRR-NUC domain-containing protein [Marinobacterium rhizophilum]|uniref:phosphodiesterase I n=1 Tax=Marinobacterium rhizophilum TaxID=420402 RepID=A0ABY5HQA4_9GAMM|nr:VRR-NUC domain-containing protein [Marinobacterium rhizophilum]UTW14498.1 VRR-NUC domain-containing protein [Marinobacterium rhizophilum]